MCSSHHEEGRGRGHRHGFRGFGRRGFPNREALVERLRAYQEHLESEARNVQDLLGRLADAPEAPTEVE